MRHAAIAFALLGLSCGGAPVRPTPCMSDRECQGDRICHQGSCMFEEEARAALARGLTGEEHAPGEETSGGAEVTPPTPEAVVEQPMFMGGPQRTGRSPRRGPATVPDSQRILATGARVFASPVVGRDGTIYIGSLDRTFNAISPDGQLRWRHTGRDKFYSTAAVAPDGTVVVGCHDGTLFALTPAGQPRYQATLPAAIDASPVIARDGTVYVTSNGLYAIGTGGDVLFHVPAPDALRSSPALHPAGLVVYGTTDGRLVAVHAYGHGSSQDHPATAWELRTQSSMESGPAVASDGTIYVGTDRGQVIAVSPEGRELWRYEVGSDVRATPAIAADGTVIVGGYDGQIHAIRPDGARRWTVQTSGRIRASARIDAEGRIYVGSQDDNLYAISPDGHTLWQRNMGQDIDSTVGFGPDGTLYVGVDDGGVYRLSAP